MSEPSPEKARADLEELLPGLKGAAYSLTSKRDKQYNCIAWAAGDGERWWWPHEDAYWPPGVPREETLEAFVELFRALGYETCDDDAVEPSFEKVAIFASDRGPEHAARQRGGVWTSKIGFLEDIVHTVEALQGESYGQVVRFMKRRLREAPS